MPNTPNSVGMTILDVGHGNCALITFGDTAIVIDAPLGATLLAALLHFGIRTINTVLVSHADADHIGGILALLSDPRFTVKAVHLNPDVQRNSNTWQDLRVALKDARARTGLHLSTQLTSSTTFAPINSGTSVEVLWPTPEIAMSGAGGRDLKNRPISANASSAVIRVSSAGRSVALLTGDLDAVALDNLAADNIDLKASLLVFPHHGGLPGLGDAQSFAQRLTTMVAPDTVVFSIGRMKFNNPNPAIISGVRTAAPQAHIICTQLSRHCAANLPVGRPSHLSNVPSLGSLRGHACGGSLVIDLSPPHGITSPNRGDHRAFIATSAPSALCLNTNGTGTGGTP